MTLPSSLKINIEALLETTIITSTAIGGGDISTAIRLNLADERIALVKWRERAIPGMFTAEATGLRLLQQAEALRIPTIWAQSETLDDCPAFIVMEWLGRGKPSQKVEEALGAGLAQMHRATGKFYGLDHDNFIGANPQPNPFGENWIDFFREWRLGFQMDLAARNGYLPQKRGELLNKLLARLSTWLPAIPPASLLHGDLWGGNWLVTDAGEPALIDPAVYYGDREAELAFTEMFGGFSRTFYDAYNAAWPLDKGYAERRDLYKLYHLLNHLNLFGEGYGGQVDAVLRRYVG